MIVDTSALIAILRSEPDADVFARAIAEEGRPRISAASYVEAGIVADRQADPSAGRLLDDLIEHGDISIEPLTVEVAHIARQAYRDYGKDRHPAGLNFGDCFSYALAKATGEPLLFKGDDFSKTDVVF